MPLLTPLHWLKAPEQIEFKLAILAGVQMSAPHGSVVKYLAEEFHQLSDVETRQRLRSASSSSLDVRRTRLTTVGDRDFPDAAFRLWNTLPQNVMPAPSLTVFRKRLKTHLFHRS